MKKLFISQPMRGKSDEEILKTRDEIKIKAEKEIGEEVELIDSFVKEYPGEINKVVPVYYLGISIQFLSQADVAYFGGDWENARGCKIEHDVAKEYGIEILYCNTIPKELTLTELINCFHTASEYSKKYVSIGIKIPDCTKPEIIIIVKENFDAKLTYYKSAYNNDLTLKTCNDIKIIGFSYGNSFEEMESNIIKK